jgi:hypothetical protein
MAHGKAVFVRHAFRADSDLVTRADGNTDRQLAAVSNRVELASARITSVAVADLGHDARLMPANYLRPIRRDSTTTPRRRGGSRP